MPPRNESMAMATANDGKVGSNMKTALLDALSQMSPTGWPSLRGMPPVSKNSGSPMVLARAGVNRSAQTQAKMLLKVSNRNHWHHVIA